MCAKSFDIILAKDNSIRLYTILTNTKTLFQLLTLSSKELFSDRTLSN